MPALAFRRRSDFASRNTSHKIQKSSVAFACPPWAALRAARASYAISASSFIRTAGQGFEPQYPPSKGGVLPLDEPAIETY